MLWIWVLALPTYSIVLDIFSHYNIIYNHIITKKTKNSDQLFSAACSCSTRRNFAILGPLPPHPYLPLPGQRCVAGADHNRWGEEFWLFSWYLILLQWPNSFEFYSLTKSPLPSPFSSLNSPMAWPPEIFFFIIIMMLMNNSLLLLMKRLLLSWLKLKYPTSQHCFCAQ